MTKLLCSRIMCGRYTLRTPPEVLKQRFGLAEVPGNLVPRYNIAPGQEVAVVPNLGERRLEMYRWGLIPSWAKDPSIGNKLINARAETVAEKPSFRTAIRKRRCLVLADGFYEWKGKKAPRTPMYVRLKSGEPFAFAGLWDSWSPSEGETVCSCTILTTNPNSVLADVHDRMPVILPAEACATWIAREPLDPKELSELLVPFPGAEMEAYAVSPLVNRPGYDRPECIEPV